MGLSGTTTGTNAGTDRSDTNVAGTDGPERGGSLSGANRPDTNGPGAPLFGTNAGRRTGTNDPGRTEPGKGGETP
jgi:hypothetical protein